MTVLQTAQYPRPNHILLHLSDTHILAEGALYGAVDSAARLAQILTELAGSGLRAEAMIFTGDLADRGEPEAYNRLRFLVEPVARQLGAQLIWGMGNHDDSTNLRRALLPDAPEAGPLDDVYNVNGLRVITLDTSVPGEHFGRLSSAQVSWLEKTLSVPAPDGTLLALHHPPMPALQDLAVIVELQQQERLAKVLAGSDVRMILAGHAHYSAFATFAGIPVVTASATSYTQDLTAPSGSTRGRDGAQSVNLIHVYAETIVSSVVPMGHNPQVGEYVSAEETAARLAAARIHIKEGPPGAPAASETWPSGSLSRPSVRHQNS